VICSTPSTGSARTVSLRETAIDTTTPRGCLTISILASIAQFERELILSRISEGRKRARKTGIKFGRKPKLTAYQRQEALERLAEGEKAPLPEASMSSRNDLKTGSAVRGPASHSAC
jgi:DNA invertase Pin-like site-specific DNA recombinase